MIVQKSKLVEESVVEMRPRSEGVRGVDEGSNNPRAVNERSQIGFVA
jgi:hypothetical protein